MRRAAPPAFPSLLTAGRGVLPCYVGDGHPLLERLTPPIPELAAEYWIIVHRDLRRAACVWAYRDIQTLIASGAPIRGEAGIGYVLLPGYTLPPLMFTEEEIEAIVLGSRIVMESADARLVRTARDALAKITLVLPGDRAEAVPVVGLLSGPRRPIAPDGVDLALLRQAIRVERKIWITYSDEAGNRTDRRVWPISLTFFDRVRVLAAWCELRQGFRHFRTDRMLSLVETIERLPRPRRVLLKEWRQAEGLPDPD
jgi:predicted DNA-binding transcriptional regulator YafY